MGNSNSQIDYAARNKINRAQWTEVQHNQHFKILKNNNGTLAEEYNFSADSNVKVNTQLQIYDYRRNQTQPVVRTLGVQFLESSTSNCCGKHHAITVLTERIPYRLSNIGLLNFNESLYVLDKSLRGYRAISKKLKSSYITSNMIGFTPEGFVKVWINDNWPQNHPNSPVSTQKALDDLHGSTTEQKMVLNIFNVIETNTEGRFPQSFSQNFTASKNLNFDQAINTLQTYIQSNTITLLTFIRLNRTENNSPSKIEPKPTNLTNTNIRFTYSTTGNNVRASNNQVNYR